MYTVIAIFFGFAVLELLMNGYKWAKQPFWALRGVLWLVVLLVVSESINRYVDPHIHFTPMIDLSYWGVWAAIPILFVYEFIVYLVHRAQHNVDFLWRIHQLHHSSERLDIWSAHRFHPLEIPMFHAVGLLTFAFLFECAEGTMTWVGTFILVIQTFEHTNVKTPRWLGYIIARPENHMLHHARDQHHSNYSDLPIVDMLFGTFENPVVAPTEFGFWDGASQQVIDQFLGQDIVKNVRFD